MKCPKMSGTWPLPSTGIWPFSEPGISLGNLVTICLLTLYCFLNWLWKSRNKIPKLEWHKTKQNKKNSPSHLINHSTDYYFLFIFKNVIMSEYLHKALWSIADWQAREAGRASRPLLGLIKLLPTRPRSTVCYHVNHTKSHGSKPANL